MKVISVKKTIKICCRNTVIEYEIKGTQTTFETVHPYCSIYREKILVLK